MKKACLAVLAAVCLLLAGCSDDEGKGAGGYAVFMEDALSLSASGGRASVTVEWGDAEWQVGTASVGGFIANIEPSTGGGHDGRKHYTTVSFDFLANTGGNQRTQQLTLRNAATGETSVLTVTQAAGGRSAYYVSADGSDDADGTLLSPFKTIARAAEAAAVGDTVYISGGVYAECDIRPASSGAAEAMIVFRPKDGEAVTLRHPATDAADSRALFDLTGCSHIRIQGLRFDGYSYGKAAVYISGGEGNEVTGCTFSGLGNGEVSAWDATSVIFIYRSSGNAVCHNTFTDITGDGVAVNSGCSGNLVACNTFADFHGKPRSWSDGGTYSSAITCQDTGPGGNVFAMNSGERLVTFLWFDRAGSGNIAVRNTCCDSRTFIFNESRCEHNLIMENTACGVTGAAFQTARYGGTDDTYAASYVGNVAYGCGYGFYIDRLHTSEMRGNIAAESTEYDLVFTQNAIDYGPHTINSNLFYTEGRSASILLASKEASVETFGQAVSGTGNISADPLLADPAGGDFTLLPGSAAVGAGEGGADIGAYSAYLPDGTGCGGGAEASSGIGVSFATASQTLASGGTAAVTLTLERPSASAVKVAVKAVAGDMRGGTDFTPAAPQVTFSPGETSKTVSLSFLPKAAGVHAVVFAIDVQTAGACAGARRLHVVRM